MADHGLCGQGVVPCTLCGGHLGPSDVPRKVLRGFTLALQHPVGYSILWAGHPLFYDGYAPFLFPRGPIMSAVRPVSGLVFAPVWRTYLLRIGRLAQSAPPRAVGHAWWHGDLFSP